MIFEDAHWADPTSLELFGRIIDKILDLNVLLIVTYRPEFDPPSIEGLTCHGSHTQWSREAQKWTFLIDRVPGDEEHSQRALGRTLSNALTASAFLEEMTKAVLEAGGRSRRTSGRLLFHHLLLPAPSSLNASLMAHLDRLGLTEGSRRRVGGVVGREFSHSLLAAVARKPEVETSIFDLIVSSMQVFCRPGFGAVRDLSV